MPKTKVMHLVRNPTERKPTIYDVLKNKLGREPTRAELNADVKRILSEGTQELAAKGKLRHQRMRKNPLNPKKQSRAAKHAAKVARSYGKRVKKSRRPRITVANRNLRRTDRSPQQYIIEAMQEKPNRRFKFWYWDGTQLTTDKSAALKFVSASQAQPVARRILTGVPSSILYVRVVRA